MRTGHLADVMHGQHQDPGRGPRGRVLTQAGHQRALHLQWEGDRAGHHHHHHHHQGPGERSHHHHHHHHQGPGDSGHHHHHHHHHQGPGDSLVTNVHTTCRGEGHHHHHGPGEHHHHHHHHHHQGPGDPWLPSCTSSAGEGTEWCIIIIIIIIIRTR